ncbi:MAG: hypothetical protein GTN74_06115 [Proteobacteria bacterium]|nr:hypothetical protein [Pseudomonadota bacterium]NIS69123.1 hypothetical protein [Pseudomonadota bacterium]
MTRLNTSLAVFVILFFSGCTAIGPRTIPRDRFDYASAISDSWKRVMLLNIVKMRYGDVPVFLDVSSVINQYSLEGVLRGGLAWDEFVPGNSQTVGGRARYIDRPTITYNPLTGEKFTRSLLTPIPPGALLSLIQAGWPAEFLFRISVTTINGVYNRRGAALVAREADPDFDRLLKAFTRVQQSGGLGMRVMRKDDKEASVLFFRRELDDEIAAEVRAAKKILGLRAEANEYKVVYGSFPADDQEIAILTRSMIEISAELAAHVDIPPSHVEENRASPGWSDRADSKAEARSRVRISSQTERPTDAFVSVRYRGHWFFIDDRDFRSKRMFTFLMFLLTLAETGAPERAPVITIPTG